MIIGIFLIGISLLMLFLGNTGSYRLLPPFLASGNAQQNVASSIATNIIAGSGGGSHGVR